VGTAGRALLTWQEATSRALYGEGGFYRRTGAPAAHFRTSVHASPSFADAVVALARSVGADTVTDVGAGGGELLQHIHRAAGDLRLVGVEVADRPAALAGAVEWRHELPEMLSGLVVANEWLDDVPVDVAVLTPDGPRLLVVDPVTGEEEVGPPVPPVDAAWLDRWWPLTVVGRRAEIGRPRDEAWASVVGRLEVGVAFAVDYGHERASRPPQGTLAGYRAGRLVRPVPDGSCDITAHVALDACAAAGQAHATATLVTTQRSALDALGVSAERPGHALARRDPGAYLAALARAGEAAELRDPSGLGGFGWLVQTVGAALPEPLAGVTVRR
jgi:SAM-dependent MidA family methyltransferase